MQVLVWKTNFDNVDFEEKLQPNKLKVEPNHAHTHDPPLSRQNHMTNPPDHTHHLDCLRAPVDHVTPPLNVVNVGPRLFHKPESQITDPTHHHATPTKQSHDPSTTPLEQMTMSPQLASTLEHIVGQLDILTQVSSSL